MAVYLQTTLRIRAGECLLGQSERNNVKDSVGNVDLPLLISPGHCVLALQRRAPHSSIEQSRLIHGVRRKGSLLSIPIHTIKIL